MNSLEKTNLESSFPTSVSQQSQPIKLVVQGLGHVPSFKNNKLLTRGKLITKPEYQKWMERATESIALQLLFESQTTAGETRQECWKRLRTFLSGLSDDSIRELPEGSWKTERVENGNEGAIIEIIPL